MEANVCPASLHSAQSKLNRGLLGQQTCDERRRAPRSDQGWTQAPCGDKAPPGPGGSGAQTPRGGRFHESLPIRSPPLPRFQSKAAKNRYFAHFCNTRSKLIKINPTPASAWSCFGHGCIDSVFWSPRTRVVTQTLTMAVIVGGLGEALRSITRAADRAATQQGAAGARQPHPEHPGRRPAALAVLTRV